jgi:hypothetical protein
MWEGTRDWPAKHGADIARDFAGSFDRSIEEVFDEVVYYLAFATDFAFWRQLEKTPDIQNSVRDVFASYVGIFAQAQKCPGIPCGDWMGDSLIWMRSDALIEGEPKINLQRRFELYGRSLSRRKDRSAGERVAHILAALCGTMDAVFILYATPLFLGRWNGVQDILGSFKIRR